MLGVAARRKGDPLPGGYSGTAASRRSALPSVLSAFLSWILIVLVLSTLEQTVTTCTHLTMLTHYEEIYHSKIPHSGFQTL